MKKITIIGSSNIDITARVSSLPRPGETVGGGRISQANGGKGANQAVAAARLGADAAFITCIGDDTTGRTLAGQFALDGLDTSLVKYSGTPTGTALIFVDDNAENCIAVAPGANNDLLPEDIDAAGKAIAGSGFVLLQLEIPMETVERAVDIAYKGGAKVVLNPAPMRELPDSLLSKLYLITPNETEAEKITGMAIGSEEDARKAAGILLAKGVKNVIITMGSAGSLVCTADGTEFVPARKVKAVDTTAAGDVYNGALVTALSEGKTLVDAARFATKASSISVTRPGAQTSAPSRSEVDSL